MKYLMITNLSIDSVNEPLIYSEVPTIQRRAQAQGSSAIFQSPGRLKNVEKQKPRFLFFASEKFMDELFRVSLIR